MSFVPSSAQSSTEVNRREVLVPRLGEGIEIIKITAILVAVGDSVSRDAPLIEVETDKASHLIESPVSGEVDEICCRPGSVLHVGAVMAVIAAEDGGARVSGSSVPSPDDLEDDLPSISIRKRHQVRTSARITREPERADVSSQEAYDGTKHEFSAKQLLIARGLRESQSISVATIEMELDWGRVEALRRQVDRQIRPSGLELVAWAVVRAMRDHRRFRAVRSPNGEYRIPDSPGIGIAVALPDDELAIAPVADTGGPEFPAFVARTRIAVHSAADWGSVSGVAVVISDMSSFGVTAATPVVVAPSIATLFIGAPEWRPQRGNADQLAWTRIARLILAFDHGLINGAGAASFMAEVIESISSDDAIRTLALGQPPFRVDSPTSLLS